MPDLTDNDAAEIKNFLSRTCDDVLSWLPGTGWQPAWQSEAADELGNSEIDAGGAAWGEAPIRTAYTTAAVFLFTATDCLRAMADSVNLLTTTFTSGVQARAAMESGSQAWWLLEGGIGARRRVIRSILIRASSARRLGEAVKNADPAGKVSDYGEDQARVRAYAKTLGLSYVCNDKRTECEGEVLPGYTKRATDFEKAVGVSSAYSIYSGAAHSELYAVMQGWRDVGPPHPAGTLLEPRPDRKAVWTSVIIGAGFVMVPAFEALLRLAVPCCRSLILTTFGRPGYLRRAMESGACGFVVKDTSPERLADAIRRVAAGQRVVDPALAATTLAAGASPLTARERDVLVAARLGTTVTEIASKLFLSEGTVRNYLSAAIAKTGTRNRAEAVRTADELGWL
ncbi:MAG: response regulator transcription factor [Streptosporangiaceae bacterium]